MSGELLTIISVMLGGAITWIAAHGYYRRAGEDLQREAAELQRLTMLILTGMEAAKLAEFSRDQHGRITGVVFHISGQTAIFEKKAPPATLGIKAPAEPGKYELRGQDAGLRTNVRGPTE